MYFRVFAVLGAFFALAACQVPPEYDDRPSAHFKGEDAQLTKPSIKTLQEALFDERRVWELCDGINFGCIIEQKSRYTLTVQLENTVLIGRHGIYSGLKYGCGNAIACPTNDMLWHAPRPDSDDQYSIEAQLYNQAQAVWTREMRRLKQIG